MDSIFEKQRTCHEVIERLEHMASTFLLDNPGHYRGRLSQSHKVSKLVEKISEISATLYELYEDKSNSRQTEFDNIACPETDFSEFYSRLGKIQAAHYGSINEYVEPVELEYLPSDQPKDDTEFLQSLFSGPERLGRNLDLYSFHVRFLNLDDAPKPSYLSFLSKLLNDAQACMDPSYINDFSLFASLPLKTRICKQYNIFLKDWVDYLNDFAKRIKPLDDLDAVRLEIGSTFDKLWDSRQVPGWNADFIERAISLVIETQIGNPAYFCAVCMRKHPTESIYQRHLNDRRHKRANSEPKFKTADDAIKAISRECEDNCRLTAMYEWFIGCYCSPVPKGQLQNSKGVLGATLSATIEHIERRQTLTETELLEEQDDDEDAIIKSYVPSFDGDHHNDHVDLAGEERIYNPLRLPIGWDGKPIPYWLYKLHGLSKEYPCEICGNFVYMGRRAYERHFQEWRHAHGMKCLGIPNTRHFHEINIIEDAIALYDKLKNDAKSLGFQAEDEEFEDAVGNVYNRKVYEDLLRQGLLPTGR